MHQEALAEGTVRLRIQGGLSVYDAAAIKRALVDAVHQHARVELDLSTVDDLDTAGVQLLMLAKQESLRQQHEMHIVAHSDAVISVFEFLNLAAFFGDPLVLLAESE
ncbi:MAG: STAS domain-containing protein [Pseudomonadales bacterium]|nr:STAS domain-containing protein [Pseudomonadales bacterium]